MKRKTVLITGVSQGIGLGLANHYWDAGWKVFGAYRSDPKGFCYLSDSASLGGGPDRDSRVEAQDIKLDVTSIESIQAAFKQLRTYTSSLDLLIINAVRFGDGQDSVNEKFDIEDMMLTYRTNTLGPLLVTQAAIPFLEHGDGKKVIHISSKVGSIQDNSSGGMYGYRASKTALNMINQNLALELKSKSIISVIMHPGWVQTSMGGTNAPVKVNDSVADITKTIEKFTMEHTGGFFERTGERIPF